MHPSTDISVDLPKLAAKAAPAFPRRLQTIVPVGGRGGGDAGRRLVQRYKSELYESQSAKCDNEFMEFASGENRNSCVQSLPKKQSFSFISTERGSDDSPPPRDYSVNFRRRRLPKLIAIRAREQRKLQQQQPTLSSNVLGITFYPHKLAANQTAIQ